MCVCKKMTNVHTRLLQLCTTYLNAGYAQTLSSTHTKYKPCTKRYEMHRTQKLGLCARSKHKIVKTHFLV